MFLKSNWPLSYLWKYFRKNHLEPPMLLWNFESVRAGCNDSWSRRSGHFSQKSQLLFTFLSRALQNLKLKPARDTKYRDFLKILARAQQYISYVTWVTLALPVLKAQIGHGLPLPRTYYLHGSWTNSLSDVPRLPPLQTEDDEIVQEDIIEEDPAKPDMHKERRVPEPPQQKKVSRPKKANPYDDQSAQYWPIIISIGVFLPTVILLCKSMWWLSAICCLKHMETSLWFI